MVEPTQCAILCSQIDPHVDAVIKELNERGRVEAVRVNSEDFPKTSRLWHRIGGVNTDSELSIDAAHRVVRCESLKSVWLRHPTEPVVPPLADERDTRFAVSQAKESLTGFLLSNKETRWVNDPWAERSAENKISQTLASERVGITVPEHVVTNDPDRARAFITSGPTVYKPLLHPAFSLEAGDTSMRTSATILLEQQHLDHLDGVRYSPALFQRWIPKHREYRVTIVGRKCFAAEIDPNATEGAGVDWREAKLDDLAIGPADLDPALVGRLLDLVSSFGLLYAAIDLILGQDGRFYFLDLNPSGQFLFVERMVPELPITTALCELLDS